MVQPTAVFLAADGGKSDWTLASTLGLRKHLIIKLAERGGFEPPVRFNPYNGLANRRFRPLSHLSINDLQLFRLFHLIFYDTFMTMSPMKQITFPFTVKAGRVAVKIYRVKPAAHKEAFYQVAGSTPMDAE